MTLQEFNSKLEELRIKSGMREDVNWPIVYDEDEIGEIYITQDGQLFFADKMSNWVQSHLTVASVANIRYKSVESANKSERDIFVNFESGDYIKLHNWKKNSIIYTSVSLLKTEENEAAVDLLKESCECYDNVRGNTLYVTVRKTGK